MAVNNNIIITRENYEEYFLLYVDRELTPEARLLVEQFVAENTDLATELEALRQATLVPPPINFINKNNLYKTSPLVTLDNYTEYFVRHIDAELSMEETAALQQFLQQQPWLQAELDLFASAKLPAEQLVFDDKLSLYKNAGATIINQYNYTEFFALYADNGLDTAAKKAVETFAAATPGMQQELKLFLQTRMQPDMQVVFPGKSGLYRHQQERRPVVPMWLRFAAAAAVLAFIAWFAFNGAGASSGSGETPVASNNNSKQPAKQPAVVHLPAQNNNNTAGDMAQTTPAGTENNSNAAVNAPAPVNNLPLKTGFTGNKNEGTAVTMPDANRNTNRNEQQAVINPAITQDNNNSNTAANNNKPGEQLPPELKAILKPQQSQEAMAVQNQNGSQVQPGNGNEKPPVQQDVAVKSQPAAEAQTSETTDSDIAIMNVPAGNVARKNGLRGLSRKVSRFFERKIKNIGNSPVSVGGFEVAVAR